MTINGITALEIYIRSLLAIAPVMYRLTPIGGVQYPMARFTVRIRPKCIQLILKASNIGKNTGPRIMVAEIISINMPTKRSSEFMARRKT